MSVSIDYNVRMVYKIIKEGLQHLIFQAANVTWKTNDAVEYDIAKLFFAKKV